MRFATILLLLMGSFSGFAQQDSHSLNTSSGKLSYAKGKIQLNFNNGLPATSPSDLKWKLKLEDPEQNFDTILLQSSGQAPTIKKIAGGFMVCYTQLKKASQSYQIALDIIFTTEGQKFNLSSKIRNNEKKLVVVEFDGPILSGINLKMEDYNLIMPNGVGQEFVATPTAKIAARKVSFKGGLSWISNKAKGSYGLTAHYPSRFATMQWCAFKGKNGGVYLGSHDVKHGSKIFNVNYMEGQKQYDFSFSHQVAIHPQGQYDFPAMVIYPFKGSWHQAADVYRKWFDTSIPLVEVPTWAKNASGWMLTILKQQNNEVMWDYPALNEMNKLSVERGLDIIGLYGWAHGGHDRFYPDYYPDTLMGGHKALVKALADIKKAGKRSIIYVNGQLMDQNGTNYWDSIGKSINIVKKDKQLDYQKWHKYKDAPARFHGLACLSADLWYQRMLQLAKEANDYGADGIIYDQLAVTAPKYCYATNHNHKTPEVMYTGDRYAFLRKIATTMKTINPDFIVMTEGLSDVVLNAVAWFHGYENGVYVPTQKEIEDKYGKTAYSSVYPEMFKYTFPEMLTTTRNPSPVNNRLILNYATVYGFRQELESRYAADVRYLKENRIPEPEDYANVISKPDLELVTSQDPIAMKAYTKAIIDFQRENADLLWHGKYIDGKKFDFTGTQLVAKAFENGNRLGVLIWNYGAKAQSFILNVPGYVLETVTAPGKAAVAVNEPLAAESIRLMTWKKVP
ncbi:DUF6259 domain-containing protein [Pedobacter nanyangensis]|uniref:DUF6259 domain-containing protein n=1 Tax=Pedobacter nanyangensis TaxID=1562389 RepID=UPI0013B37DFB|nr:DUF6259 domain-containing protein [Pedobacter nanyangensis]